MLLVHNLVELPAGGGSEPQPALVCLPLPSKKWKLGNDLQKKLDRALKGYEIGDPVINPPNPARWADRQLAAAMISEARVNLMGKVAGATKDIMLWKAIDDAVQWLTDPASDPEVFCSFAWCCAQLERQPRKLRETIALWVCCGCPDERSKSSRWQDIKRRARLH